jgi:hypothetical protein
LIHEINIVFQVFIDVENIESIEAGLEFIWIPLHDSRLHNLLPESIIDLAINWLKTNRPIRLYSEAEEIKNC